MAKRTWFDSHVHLDWYKPEQLPALMDAAEKAGVGKIVSVGRSVVSSAAAVWIAQRFDPVRAAVAIHPLWPDALDADAYKQMRTLIRDKNVVAIGETGIGIGSFTPVKTSQMPEAERKLQRDKFARHIRLARETGLPVIIHNDRASGEEIAKVFEKEKGPEVGGVTHGTMMEVKDCKRLWEMGVYISIAGQINQEGFEFLHEVARQVPEDQLMIETDSAGGGPDGTRGPHKLLDVAKTVAADRKISMERLRQITVLNTNRLYHLVPS